MFVCSSCAKSSKSDRVRKRVMCVTVLVGGDYLRRHFYSFTTATTEQGSKDTRLQIACPLPYQSALLHLLLLLLLMMMTMTMASNIKKKIVCMLLLSRAFLPLPPNALCQLYLALALSLSLSYPPACCFSRVRKHILVKKSLFRDMVFFCLFVSEKSGREREREYSPM